MMLTSSIETEGNTMPANKNVCKCDRFRVQLSLEEMSGKRKYLMDMEYLNTRFSGFQASAYYVMCGIQR